MAWYSSSVARGAVSRALLIRDEAFTDRQFDEVRGVLGARDLHDLVLVMRDRAGCDVKDLRDLRHGVPLGDELLVKRAMPLDEEA